jgi:hypothetical protein
MMNKAISIVFFLTLILAIVFAAPTCTITAPTATDYNNKIDLPNFDYSCTGAIDQNAVLASTVIVDDQNIDALVTSDGSYTITVTAVDENNEVTTKTVTFVYDTTAPTGTIDSASYANDEPTLTFEATNTTGWKIKLSCTNSGPWREYNYAETITDFDITDDDYGCNKNLDEGDDGVYVFVKFVDKAGNWSTGTIKTPEMTYDTTDPELDESDFTVTAGDEEVEITWNDPNDEAQLVTVKAFIYLDDDEKTSKIKNADDESILIERLENGEKYEVELLLTDEAENTVRLDNFSSFTPQGNVATLKITPAVSYAKAGDRLTATCTFSKSTTKNAVLSYKYTGPNSDEETIEEDDGTVSGNITIASVDHTRVTFYCKANNAESATSYVLIDNVKPTIEWKDTNNLFAGVKKLIIGAKDNLSLSQVEIDFNNKITKLTTKDTNGNYSIDLNSWLYPNGTYALKAIATDGAGNKTEITRTVNLDNYVDPKDLAQRAINSAKIKQTAAVDLVDYYNNQGLVLPIDLNTKKQSADTLLLQAESEINSLPEKSKTDAETSAKLFEEFSTGATTQVKETKTYTFDLNSAVSILQEYGLSAESADAQIKTMQSTEITRKLMLIQTGSSTNRQIKIEITFVNDSNSDVIKIVEVIPKEVIDSAKKLVSDANFRIIKDDPVVEFTVNAPKGATTTLSYGLGEVDSIKAQTMMDKNLITLYETAPIVLQGELTAEKAMPQLASGDGVLFIIIILIIILIVIAIALLVIKFRSPGHGFGEEKTILDHVVSKEPETPKRKFEAFKK